MNRPDHSPRALLVLGMHRSGTSCCAGILERLGVELGSDRLHANEFNPRGFAELREVVELHDRLLEELGTSWSAPAPRIDPCVEPVLGATRRLGSLIGSRLSDTELFAVKDPRMCRLVPLWRHALEERGIEPTVLLVLRHPAAIAASLAHRDGFSPARSYMLWLEHSLRAEADTRDLPRAFVRYDDLLSDWRSSLESVRSRLELRWPVAPEAAGAAIDAFLGEDLRHYPPSGWPDGHARTYLPIAEAWDLFEGLVRADDDDGRGQLDGLAATIRNTAPLFRETAEEFATRWVEAEAEASRRERDLNVLEKQVRTLEKRLDLIARSPRAWLSAFARARGGRAR